METAPVLEFGDLEAAVRQHWAPLLKVIGLPQIAVEAPSESVMLAVQALARDSVCLSRGEFLTTIERLGTAWSNVLLQYVCQSKPYDKRDTALDVWSTLRNISDKPVNVLKRVRIRPIAKLRGNITSDGWSEVTDAHRHDTTIVAVDPGESIELVAERAIHMLRRYSWEARPPAEQDTTSRLRSDFPLREVGYRAEWVDYETGDKSGVSSEDKEAPRRKRAG